ncbi:hypothetical protein [Photobacterium damselae]|uniref:hypothetical protein n=1 Tax=Photobacterium damselae TaxID=38293 RepID=UPI00148672E8|nr:hypothetical protein [Photobacterium damselae]
MANHESYQVAIDILRCHLGMSLEEAEKELGLQNANAEEILDETPEVLIGLQYELK